MAWMYILRCSDGSYYTGSTDKDVEARVWEHNHDDVLSARFTRERRPVTLVYAEVHDRVDTAFAREKQVQGWSRAKKEALIEDRWEDLPELSRNRVSAVGDPGAEGSCSPAPPERPDPGGP